jgi:hypothetical protein
LCIQKRAVRDAVDPDTLHPTDRGDNGERMGRVHVVML